MFKSLTQEEKTGAKASEATVVKLIAQMPPIEKMDASLSTLSACEYVYSIMVVVMSLY